MRRAETLLPLKPIVFDVLLILNEAELHGYGIAKKLKENGQRVLPGNLYRVLSGMIERGLIEKSPRPRRAAESDDGERRTYFRTTAFGLEVARSEAERLRDRLAVARAQHLLSDTRSR